MQNALLTFSVFVAFGLVWRIAKPGGVTADAIQRPLIALIHSMLLPVYVFLVVGRMPLNATYMRISLVVILATAGTLAVAWFWLGRTSLSGQTKGALLLASAFSSAFFLGMPLTRIIVGNWSSRVAVDYMLISNILVLFTAGIYLARSFSESNQVTRFVKDMFREPIAWGALAGLLVNILNIRFPGWVRGVEGMLLLGFIPLLLITVGLSINWQQNWGQTMADMLPVAVIQLVVLPLLIYLVMKYIPGLGLGLKTQKVLLIEGMMPAMVWGISICERYKLDSSSYAIAFTFTSILACVSVPVWFNFLW